MPTDKADGYTRVDPGVGRVLASGPEGLPVLCVGSVPAGAYAPPVWTTE